MSLMTRNSPLSAFAVVASLAASLLVSPVNADAETVAGGSVDNPVDDALFGRLGKAARQSAVAAKETFTAKDIAAAMNRPDALGLTPLPPATGILSDEEFHRRSALATLALFAISAKDQSAGNGARLGAAFMVQPGIAATCFHAIKGLAEPFVVVAITAEGRTVKVQKILAVYPQEDLAFLQVSGAGDVVLPLRTDAPAGTRVRAIGHPVNKYFFSVEGMIARYGLKSGTGTDKLTRLNLMIASIGGFSGSAVMDAAGNVVGMLDSFDTIKAGEATYDVHSAIPAAMILAHFTRPYTSTMTPAAVAAALQPDAHEGSTVEISSIKSVSPDGTATAEVRSDDPRNYTLTIEDKAGKEIAKGKPSDAMRKNLPDWDRDLYDASCKTANAKADTILNREVAKKPSAAAASGKGEVKKHRIESKSDDFIVVTEFSSNAPDVMTVTVKDAASKEIARGKASADFRDRLPEAARAVYDASVETAREQAGH